MPKIFFICLFLLFGWLGIANADTFGTFSLGGGLTFAAQRTYCASSTPATSGTLNSISYGASSTMATRMGVALYSVDPTTGVPANLLASNAPSSDIPPATRGWATSTISYSLVGGTPYYLCVWANGSYSMAVDYVAHRGAYWKADSGWETWDDPFGAGTFTGSTVKYSIYATYTPTSETPAETFKSLIVRKFRKFSVKLGKMLKIRQ